MSAGDASLGINRWVADNESDFMEPVLERVSFAAWDAIIFEDISRPDIGSLYLIFVRPCIINTFTKYNQRDTAFLNLYISQDSLHVSGRSSCHHQEHKTVHTASGICQTDAATCCYRERDGTHLFHDSSKQ